VEEQITRDAPKTKKNAPLIFCTPSINFSPMYGSVGQQKEIEFTFAPAVVPLYGWKIFLMMRYIKSALSPCHRGSSNKHNAFQQREQLLIKGERVRLTGGVLAGRIMRLPPVRGQDSATHSRGGIFR
jgi:hypothetical protein